MEFALAPFSSDTKPKGWFALLNTSEFASSEGIVKLNFPDFVEQQVSGRLCSFRALVGNPNLAMREGYDSAHFCPCEWADCCIVGKSLPVRQIFEFCKKVAACTATVLIAGESGTGKELVARAIHRLSPRKNEPFVPVNCAAIPEELLESELFGHVRGAFTGATNARQGRFQLADGGTLFLDEIGEMSLKLQVKLLRVLQEHEFEPVGSDKSVKVDVRVIAATNRDLSSAVKEKRFREDLFYRLRVLPISLPPLRERPGDIPLLIGHFLQHHGRKKGKSLDKIEAEALMRLEGYRWPGNVRELENFVERLVILNEDGVIRSQDILDYIQSEPQRQEEPSFFSAVSLPVEGIDLDGFLRDIENKLMLAALKRAQGNRTVAAELLQLNRTTLVERLRKRGLGGRQEKKADAASLEFLVRNMTTDDFSLTA